MSKIITVFGATGNQGGSVIKALLQDPAITKEYTIRGVTRDTSKPSSQALAAKGVEMVAADMSSAEAVKPAVKDAHTVFLVTNYWEKASPEAEIAQVKAVTDASKAAGVKHIVHSTLIHVTKATEGRLTHVLHFDAKADGTDYIRQSGVPVTAFLPGYFLSNYFSSFRKQEDGSYAVMMPLPADEKIVPAFDASNDTGKYVKAAIKTFNGESGRKFYGAGEYLSLQQIVDDWSEVTGEKATYKQIPANVFESFLPPQIAKELTENMLLLGDVGYYAGASLDETNALLEEKPTTWKEFVAANKEKFFQS
jgi:uncharacterized protein YbjT (DUF2867 family)